MRTHISTQNSFTAFVASSREVQAENALSKISHCRCRNDNGSISLLDGGGYMQEREVFFDVL